MTVLPKPRPAPRIEITYRRPRESWQRKIVSARRLEAAVLWHEEEGAEILTRELAE